LEDILCFGVYFPFSRFNAPPKNQRLKKMALIIRDNQICIEQKPMTRMGLLSDAKICAVMSELVGRVTVIGDRINASIFEQVQSALLETYPDKPYGDEPLKWFFSEKCPDMFARIIEVELKMPGFSSLLNNAYVTDSTLEQKRLDAEIISSYGQAGKNISNLHAKSPFFSDFVLPFGSISKDPRPNPLHYNPKAIVADRGYLPFQAADLSDANDPNVRASSARLEK
jgi:hypothetical protein